MSLFISLQRIVIKQLHPVDSLQVSVIELIFKNTYLLISTSLFSVFISYILQYVKVIQIP